MFDVEMTHDALLTMKGYKFMGRYDKLCKKVESDKEMWTERYWVWGLPKEEEYVAVLDLGNGWMRFIKDLTKDNFLEPPIFKVIERIKEEKEFYFEAQV